MNARLEVRSLHVAMASVQDAENALKAFKATEVPEGVTDADRELIGEYDRVRLHNLRQTMKEAKGTLRRFVYRAKPFMNAKGRTMRP